MFRRPGGVRVLRRIVIEDVIMDSERFDGLVLALGHGASRRGALGLLAGVVGLGLEDVAAKGKHGHSKHARQEKHGKQQGGRTGRRAKLRATD